MGRTAKLASVFPIDCSAGDANKAFDRFSRRPRIDAGKGRRRARRGYDFKGSKISGKALFRYGDGTNNADLWISFFELDLELMKGARSLPGKELEKASQK